MNTLISQNTHRKNTSWRYSRPWRKERDHLDILKEALRKPFITIISWLRRVGKTTLMMQMIDHLLDAKVDPQHILFTSFTRSDQRDLSDLLNRYLDDRTAQAYMEHGTDIYIFLDELQYIDNRQDIIKQWYDFYPNIHFVLTWSASLWINNDRESLLWRYKEYRISGLSYEEYIRFTQWVSLPPLDLLASGESMRKTLAHRMLYTAHFETYLSWGEFPWLVDQPAEYIYEFVTTSILEVIFEKDIFLFDQKLNAQLALSLYKILLNTTWWFVSKTKVATHMWVSTYLLDKYLAVLKKTYLIHLVPNFLQSIVSQQKSYKKFFSELTSLIVIWLWFDHINSIPFHDTKGHLIENYVYTMLRRSYPHIYYYNKAWNEVDFVVQTWWILLPIEVKAWKKVTKKQMLPVVTFAKKHNLLRGYVLYRWPYMTHYMDDIEVICLPIV